MPGHYAFYTTKMMKYIIWIYSSEGFPPMAVLLRHPEMCYSAEASHGHLVPSYQANSPLTKFQLFLLNKLVMGDPSSKWYHRHELRERQVGNRGRCPRGLGHHTYFISLFWLFYVLRFLVLHILSLSCGSSFPSVNVVFHCTRHCCKFFSVAASLELGCLYVFLCRDPRMLVCLGLVFVNSYAVLVLHIQTPQAVA